MTNKNLDNKSKTRKILYFLGIGIGGIIFLWQIGKIILELSNGVIELKFSRSFVWAFIVLLFVRFIQIINWKNLMKGIGYQLPFLEVFANYSLVLLPKYIPGGIWGYISRGEWLNKKFKIDYGSSNYISVVETILVIISSVQINIFYIYYVKKKLSIFITIIIMLTLLLIPYILLNSKKSIPNNKKITMSINNFIKREKIPFINYLYSWILNILVWTGYGIAINYIAASFNIFANHSIIYYAFIFSTSWLIGFLIFFVPSGIGVREQLMTTILTNTQIMDDSYATLLSILMRGSMLLGELIFLAMGLLIIKYMSSMKDTTNVLL